MMKNYDESVEINHNPKWPYIPNHPYTILIISSSRSGKTNALLILIKRQRPDVGQLLFNERWKVGIKQTKSPKAFTDHSQAIDDVYENLEDYNPTKKRKVLIAFDDMTADMEVNKKLKPVVTEEHFPCFYITILSRCA